MKLWLRGVDLNHRPLGYEPNELPGCSTPQIQYISAFTHGQTREFATVCWLSHHQQTFLRMTRLPVVGIRFPRSDCSPEAPRPALSFVGEHWRHNTQLIN